ncbi:MAG: 2-oxoacid:ferredoxin oxidoreductase subunit alpha [Fervidicoccus sp.]
MNDEISIILGGPQGGGIDTSMSVIVRGLGRSGYGVIAEREYFSNIAGRHSYAHIRIKSSEIPLSIRYPVQLLASLDAETIFVHYKDVEEGGILIYNKSDEEKKLSEIVSLEESIREKISKELEEKGISDKVSSLLSFLENERKIKLVSFNYNEILRRIAEMHKLPLSYMSRYLSSILVGAVWSVLELNLDDLMYSYSIQFKGRSDRVQHNIELVKEVGKIVKTNNAHIKLEPGKLKGSKRLIVSGNDIVAIGKIVGGERFESYYPITPAVDECLLLERLAYSKFQDNNLGNLLVLQTEDEIAAATSAIGAALAGVRSSTSTSGPGFDLMAESISFAGMNEVPLVITFYQRAGPSTGMATRGGQGDLFTAIFSGHGEFARVVLSSGDHTEAFYDAIEAFNIAEKYQLPVIHLLDKFLANTLSVIPIPELEKVSIERGIIVNDTKNYKRFDLSSLISPRAFIGSNSVMWYTGDEHDEIGHISEDPENRKKMYEKRIKKLELVSKETPEDKKLSIYGSENFDFLLLGWGSVKGASVEAIKELKSEGMNGAYINVKMLWPFPSEEVKKYLKISEDIIAIDYTYDSLISKLVKMSSGINIEKSIVKYNGRPITIDEVKKSIKLILEKREKRVVLEHGA